MGVGAFAAFLLGKPHVWHIREFVYEDRGQVFVFGHNITWKLIDLLSQVCIVNSKAVAQKYEQWIAPAKLKVVYQAVMGYRAVYSSSLRQGNLFAIKAIVWQKS